MKKQVSAILILSMLLGILSGCGPASGRGPGEEGTEQTETTEAVITATVPADGDPNDVTCKGSYTVQNGDDAVVAVVKAVIEEPEAEETAETEGAADDPTEETAPQEPVAEDATLTNAQLQVWYWAEVAAYRQAGHEANPDYDAPLDTQVCEIDDSVGSWQQYFLRRALTTWHSVQALILQSKLNGLPVEEAYKPTPGNHEKYMQNIPATKFLYAYNDYAPNTMHQAYLDSLPELLDALAVEKGYFNLDEMAEDAFGTSGELLEEAVHQYNYAYTFFTNLSYDIELTQEETAGFYAENKDSYPESGSYVNFRQLLVVPKDIVEEDTTPDWAKTETEPTEPVILDKVEVAEDGTVTASEAAWDVALKRAKHLLHDWDTAPYYRDEGTFADMTRHNSDDPGSTINGGAYCNIRKGQLTPVLDEWCFDESRQEGDTTILRSDYGYHVLYFSGRTEVAEAEAKTDLTAERQKAIVTTARMNYPMEVTYGDIALTEADGGVGYGDVLYPDVAHERFPEAPLYLQQDYQTTMYGAFPIRSYGCGITTFAMLASYMTDDELTPPEMCASFSNYSFRSGTDGRLFNLEPDGLGFYLKEKTYDHRIARQALEDGYMVVCLQHKGFWTRGGHYLLLEKMNEDGTVQVRDSNLYNYQKLKGHFIDSFEWSTIPTSADGFWIFENKIVNIPACSRCGNPEGVVNSLLTESYICEKCEPAILRRDTYLTACGE